MDLKKNYGEWVVRKDLLGKRFLMEIWMGMDDCDEKGGDWWFEMAGFLWLCSGYLSRLLLNEEGRFILFWEGRLCEKALCVGRLKEWWSAVAYI